MLRIAGQTAGPYRLKFLWTLMGGGGVIGKNKFDIFSKNFFQTLFFSILGPSAIKNYFANYLVMKILMKNMENMNNAKL